MNDGSVYDADYFLRGKQTGKSLYEDYRWMPEVTVSMARTIAAHLGMRRWQSSLDFGCARGYVVKAFQGLGYLMEGVDCSEWAVANADEQVASYLYRGTRPRQRYDWIVAKDVLEHVEDIWETINSLFASADMGIFAVVPLSHTDGAPYVVPEYEKDVTHRHRLKLATWAEMFTRADWTVEMSYRVRGVKDNYAQHRFGNGFITARRIDN